MQNVYLGRIEVPIILGRCVMLLQNDSLQPGPPRGGVTLQGLVDTWPQHLTLSNFIFDAKAVGDGVWNVSGVVFGVVKTP